MRTFYMAIFLEKAKTNSINKYLEIFCIKLFICKNYQKMIALIYIWMHNKNIVVSCILYWKSSEQFHALEAGTKKDHV